MVSISSPGLARTTNVIVAACQKFGVSEKKTEAMHLWFDCSPASNVLLV